jgi:hypothetical protein
MKISDFLLLACCSVSHKFIQGHETSLNDGLLPDGSHVDTERSLPAKPLNSKNPRLLKDQPSSTVQREKVSASGKVRCGTRNPTSDDKEMNFKVFRAWKEAGDHGRQRQGTINVPVSMVVFSSTSGRGDVSDQQISEQIEVLNSAYAPFFNFTLQNLRRIQNRRLFICDGDNDGAITIPYRQGGAETLNIYTCDPSDDSLGWATYPFSIGDDDGVVLNYGTLPGGDEDPYNLGDVSSLIASHGNAELKSGKEISHISHFYG